MPSDKRYRSTQAVILAGGLGTRLRPYTYEVPKPMIMVKGKPFLHYQIMYLNQIGIKNILLLVGYLGDHIKSYFGDGSDFGVSIQYSTERGQPQGTGGAIRKAWQLIDDSFFLIYGDSFLPIDYSKLYERFIVEAKIGLVVVRKSDHGNMAIDKDFNITRYKKDSDDSQLKYIDAGVSVFSKDILKFFGLHRTVSLEEQVFPALIRYNELAGFITNKKFYDIGTPRGLSVFMENLNDYFPNSIQG